jgi:SAM-dependent methyltransferase
MSVPGATPPAAPILPSSRAEAAVPVSCDLCGAPNPRFVLTSPTLDGPLVECVGCGFRFVGGRRENLAFGALEAKTTAERIREANLIFEDIPRDEERRLNERNARWRMKLIRDVQPGGRLLEVGCGRGDFLRVASERFDVYGVEPNPELARDSAHSAPVHEGLLDGVTWSEFDVVASFHVIEHVDSPSKFVAEMVRRLKPGGVLVIETPDIGSWPFRLLKARWRQFIPEHYYFFDRGSMMELLGREGLSGCRIQRIGKYASPDFILNRLARHLPFVPKSAGSFLGGRMFRLNPFDIMLAIATKDP